MLDPSPTHQASTQDPTSDKSQGGSGPPVPPLDPRLNPQPKTFYLLKRRKKEENYNVLINFY